MNLYWVNWLYINSDGKTCQGFFGEGQISLEKALKESAWLRDDEKTVCLWINRSEEQPDGSFKYAGTPYMESFVDAFGNRTARTLKVMDEREEPKKPMLRKSDEFQCELNVCPTCGHIVEGVESIEQLNYCSACGQRIDWS